MSKYKHRYEVLLPVWYGFWSRLTGIGLLESAHFGRLHSPFVASSAYPPPPARCALLCMYKAE